MSSSLFQVRLAGKQIRSKCQNWSENMNLEGSCIWGARNYSEHLKLAGRAHRALCVRFYKNSTSGLPLWGVGKEEKDGAVHAVRASMLCVCVYVGVNTSPGLVSAALHSQLWMHFLYVSLCMHTPPWGILPGWPWGHSSPALTYSAMTGDTAPGTHSPPCLATSNNWHG